jgi:hypothetical protein
MDNTNKEQKEMNNKHIREAIEVASSLHESIDSYRFPADIRVTYHALGQCLSSLMERLKHNEHRNAATQ